MPVPVKSTDLVYLPVPKVACTTIKFALLNHNEDGQADRLDVARRTDKSVPNVHMIYPSKPLKLKHLLRYFGRRWFCVVRDPVKRFLSVYGNRVVHHDDLKRSVPALESAGLPRHPDPTEFAEHLEAYCRMNGTINHHARPMVDYLGERPGRFDRIFPMSELGELPGYLAEAGVRVTLGHRQTGGPKLKPDDLSPPALARVKRFYAADYEAFGAFFD